jgi:hypothetical protein
MQDAVFLAPERVLAFIAFTMFVHRQRAVNDWDKLTRKNTV